MDLTNRPGIEILPRRVENVTPLSPANRNAQPPPPLTLSPSKKKGKNSLSLFVATGPALSPRASKRPISAIRFRLKRVFWKRALGPRDSEESDEDISRERVIGSRPMDPRY